MRQQTLAAQEALSFERDRFEQSYLAERTRSQPLLKYVAGNSSAPAEAEIVLTNAGGLARFLTIETISPQTSGRAWIHPEDTLQPTDEVRLGYRGISSFPTRVTVGYTDQFGERRQLLLVITGPTKCHQEQAAA